MSFKTLSGDRTINAARAACHKSLFSVSPVRLAEAPASPAARRANPCGACPQRPPRLHGLRLGRASSFCAQGSRSCGLFRTGSWLLVPGSWLVASWVAGEASAALKLSTPGAPPEAGNQPSCFYYNNLALCRFWTFSPILDNRRPFDFAQGSTSLRGFGPIHGPAAAFDGPPAAGMCRFVSEITQIDTVEEAL